jgi:hypothetical protein
MPAKRFAKVNRLGIELIMYFIKFLYKITLFSTYFNNILYIFLNNIFYR